MSTPKINITITDPATFDGERMARELAAFEIESERQAREQEEYRKARTPSEPNNAQETELAWNSLSLIDPLGTHWNARSQQLFKIERLKFGVSPCISHVETLPDLSGRIVTPDDLFAKYEEMRAACQKTVEMLSYHLDEMVLITDIRIQNKSQLLSAGDFSLRSLQEEPLGKFDTCQPGGDITIVIRSVAPCPVRVTCTAFGKAVFPSW